MSQEKIYRNAYGVCRTCGVITKSPEITECAKCVDKRLWSRDTNERIPASKYKDPVYYRGCLYHDVRFVETQEGPNDSVFGSRKIFLGLSARDICKRFRLEFEDLEYEDRYNDGADDDIKNFVDTFNEKWGQWYWDIDYSVSIYFPKEGTLEDLSAKTAKKLDEAVREIKKCEHEDTSAYYLNQYTIPYRWGGTTDRCCTVGSVDMSIDNTLHQ